MNSQEWKWKPCSWLKSCNVHTLCNEKGDEIVKRIKRWTLQPVSEHHLWLRLWDRALTQVVLWDHLCFPMRSFEISEDCIWLSRSFTIHWWANPFFQFHREVLQPKSKWVLQKEAKKEAKKQKSKIGIFQHKFNAEVMWKGWYLCD